MEDGYDDRSRLKDERERLAHDGRRRHVRLTMKRPRQHRIRALLLTLLLALGMSLTFVHGGLMAAEMVVSAEASVPTGCDGCTGDPGDADVLACQSVCGSAAHGLLSGEPAATPAVFRTTFGLTSPVLGGRSNRPDHGPPKTLTLG